MDLLVAFATDDGKHFNADHFGMAKSYLVYRISEAGDEFIEERKNVKFEEDESAKHGDPEKARLVSQVMKGMDVMVSRKFGQNITRMKKKFVCVIVKTESIEQAVKILKAHWDEVLDEKKKTSDRNYLVFKD